MGQAIQRYESRKKALEKLQNIIQHPVNTMVIHYSCESFYERTEGTSPRIISIAIKSLSSGQTTSFSIHQMAEREGYSLSDIELHYNELEKMLLDNFYKFVGNRKGYCWLHWNMSSINYGFLAIGHRYQVLGGEPIEIPESDLVDLSICLKSIYGRHYIGSPRFNTLVTKNDLVLSDFMTGKQEADAIVAKDFIRVNQSTLAKVYILGEILDLSANGNLKTDIKQWQIKSMGLVAAIEYLREHIVIKIIGLIVLLGGLIVLILRILGKI